MQLVNEILDSESEPSKGDGERKRDWSMVNPRGFSPQDEDQEAAYEAWKTLEPKNENAFQTYFRLVDRGLTADCTKQILEEIEASDNVENPGALFVAKAKGALGIDRI